MVKIKRWLMNKQRDIWSEPALPKYVKINPLSPPGSAEGLQPGDISMVRIAEEFLEEDEDLGQAPEEGMALLSDQVAVLLLLAGGGDDGIGNRRRAG